MLVDARACVSVSTNDVDYWNGTASVLIGERCGRRLCVMDAQLLSRVCVQELGQAIIEMCFGLDGIVAGRGHGYWLAWFAGLVQYVYGGGWPARVWFSALFVREGIRCMHGLYRSSNRKSVRSCCFVTCCGASEQEIVGPGVGPLEISGRTTTRGGGAGSVFLLAESRVLGSYEDLCMDACVGIF